MSDLQPDPVASPASARVPWIERTFPPDVLSIYLVSLAMIALLLAAWGAGMDARPDGRSQPSAAATGQPQPRAPRPSEPADPPDLTRLPGGVSTVFEDDRLLVAYYGTAGTGSLGVLGEASPDEIMPRLKKAAAAFTATGRPVQPVFELIVTVAHAGPTKSGTYSSDIDRADVRAYIEAAHRHGVLLLLDLQPGTSNFLEVVKRWEWALKDPWVGLALDPEWRMSQGGTPGQRIGSVSAAEVNEVTAWLERLTVAHDLPQKVVVLHQFRGDMIRLIERIEKRPHLALVQHIDGYGPPRAKLATYRALVRPDQFAPGFKLFYDEDVPRMSPRRVLGLRPEVSFVSFQ